MTILRSKRCRQQTSSSDHLAETFSVHDQAPTIAASAVEALGYVNNDLFKAIEFQQQSKSHLTDNGEVPDLPDQVLRATRAVPPRPYTDTLVQNFFDNVNHHYAVLHQPSFMEAYVAWWSQRRESQMLRKIPVIALTCLVLRICANSTQFLPFPALSRMESDLGESMDTLGADYQSAAQTISDYLPPGAGGLVQCQQLFLAATWFKAEAHFVRSWHALAAAVRQAQEIGIDADIDPGETNHFEREMRRRLWCSLYTWDKFMAATFNRPSIIHAASSVPLPNPSLDQSNTNFDIPSIAVPKMLENELATQLSDNTGSNTTLADRLSFVETWMTSLPFVFSIENPHTHWDTEYPRLRFQRLQLHLVGYMTELVLLRSFITGRVLGSGEIGIPGGDRSQLISIAINTSLKAMSVSKEFFDLCFPGQAKYFMVSFCPFDNAAFLVSLLLHASKRNTIPRRQEVLGAIGQALYIARCLSQYTKMGDTTLKILSALKYRLRLQAGEKEILEQSEASGKLHNADEGIQHSDTPALHQYQVDYAVINQLQPPFDTEWQLPAQSLPTSNPAPGLDLGLLDGLWDWQSLRLDQLE
ncbi:Fc.00g010760.m01.CDS01 [Cosmosporella sp. VM-42]